MRKNIIQNLINTKRYLNLNNNNNQLEQQIFRNEIENMANNLLNTPQDLLDNTLTNLTAYYSEIVNQGSFNLIDQSEVFQKLQSIISLYKTKKNIIVQYILLLLFK